MADAKKIVIGIPTFRRPRLLAQLLASIAAQQAPFMPHVLVADNDGETGEGLRLVEKMRAKGYPFPITGVPVFVRGISQVRNALMHAAFEDLSADALAMVDDDERVDPLWIARLVAMQEQHAFDVVGGTIDPEFETQPPPWTSGLYIFYRKKYPTGPVFMINETGNVLLARSMYDRFQIEFDPAFGLTGGEDREFFFRLKQKGARFGFAPDAVSHEFFGAGRVNKIWVIQRAFQIGTGDARIFKLHSQSTWGWVKEITKIVAALVLAPFLFFGLAWSASGRMRTCLIFMRQAGKVNGLFGTPHRVYEIIHGS